MGLAVGPSWSSAPLGRPVEVQGSLVDHDLTAIRRELDDDALHRRQVDSPTSPPRTT
jgi:hypothetical protein